MISLEVQTPALPVHKLKINRNYPLANSHIAMDTHHVYAGVFLSPCSITKRNRAMHIELSPGNQTWLAGKWSISRRNPLSQPACLGDFPASFV